MDKSLMEWDLRKAQDENLKSIIEDLADSDDAYLLEGTYWGYDDEYNKDDVRRSD